MPIIKPKGKTVARLAIEFDHHGQAFVDAKAISPLGEESPMHPLQVMQLLLTVVQSTLAAGVQQNGKKQQSAGDNSAS